MDPPRNPTLPWRTISPGSATPNSSHCRLLLLADRTAGCSRRIRASVTSLIGGHATSTCARRRRQCTMTCGVLRMIHISPPCSTTITPRKSATATKRCSQVSFQWKNPDFLLRNPDFPLKNVDFITKHTEEISGFDPMDQFVMRWRGNLTVTREGPYEFMTESDDGSYLYVGPHTSLVACDP